MTIRFHARLGAFAGSATGRRPQAGADVRLLHPALARLLTWLVPLLLAVAVGGHGSARAADEEAPSFSEDSKVCVDCHGKADIKPKKLGDGKTLSMHIKGQDYLAARHQEQDCTDCHSDLMDDKEHGKKPTPLESKRALAESMQETCRDCHKKRFKLFEDSIHATLLKSGDTKAPLCASCHDPHYQPDVKIVQPLDKTPCASCHDKIFKAFALDVHGKAREAKGKDAPVCANCHQAHDVKPPSLGEGPREACLSCHKETNDKHAQWLPNTALHFDAIACVVCHAPDAERRVNLRLTNAAAGQQLREQTGVPQFATRVKAADTDNTGLDASDLRGLLAQFSNDLGPAGKAVLRGRLELRTGVMAHQLADKDKALKNCATCHSQGAHPFQTVVLSIASDDGRALRHDVQAQVLGQARSFDTVNGFYALGSTRIKLLDWLLVLGALGSIGGCAAHGFVRWTMRGQRAARKAAQAKQP